MRMTKLELRQLSPVEPPNRGARDTVQAGEIVEPYQRGVSINRLSFELKLTERAVRKILVENGVAIRGKSAAATGWAQF